MRKICRDMRATGGEIQAVDKSMEVLIVDDFAKPDQIAAAQNAGASSHIVKPFNVEALKEKMVAALGEF